MYPSNFAALIVFGLSVIAGLIALRVRSARRSEAAWQKFARANGLTFSPGGFLGQLKLGGELEGFPVSVETYRKSAGNHSQTWTRYRVSYPSLGLGLALTEQGVFAGVARFFGSQDVEVGDKVFDAGVTVKADDARAVTEFLTPVRRARIQRFLQSHTRARIEDTNVSFHVRGVESSARRLHAQLASACKLAAVLRDDAAGESEYARALEARQEGRLEDALGHARKAIDEEQDVEARRLTAELLHATEQFEQAHEALGEVSELLPADAEVRAMKEDASRQAAAPEPAPAAKRAGDDGPDVEALCRELFAEKRMSFEVNRLFDERFAGVAVSWTGTLERVDRYHSDPVFGKGPGVRAVLEVGKVAFDSYGARPVRAIVQLPESALAELGSRRGETLRFSGRLARFDAFMHNVFVADGKVRE